ncbi:MAG: tetratricopeptide repeat protein [Weeksellaceae bacterium]
MISLLYSSLSLGQSLEEKQAVQEGNNYYLQKDYDKARASYEKAIAITPSSLKGNYNLGNTYYELGKFPEAVTHYQKAVKVAQERLDKANIYHNLGNAYMQGKKYKEAMQAFKNSLRNNPSDNQTRYNYALAKKLLNNEQNNQNPPDLPKPSEYAKTMKAKADALAQRGEFMKAYGMMQKALDKDTTVLHFKNYMDKLNEVIILDTIQIK